MCRADLFLAIQVEGGHTGGEHVHLFQLVVKHVLYRVFLICCVNSCILLRKFILKLDSIFEICNCYLLKIISKIINFTLFLFYSIIN